MNPFTWLLKLSANLAQKRGGGPIDPWAYSYDASVDSRDYEMVLEVDGASLFVGNRKWPERWSQLSADASRYARATEANDGSFRLTVYERSEWQWREWEGPSIVATLDDAVALGQRLLARENEESA